MCVYVYLHLLRCNLIDVINGNEAGTQHNPAGGFEKGHKDTYGKQNESPISKELQTQRQSQDGAKEQILTESLTTMGTAINPS